MIYILSGNDAKKRNNYLKKLYGNGQPIFISPANLNKDVLFEYAQTISLFGESPVILVENLIKNKEISLSQEDLVLLNESKTVFVFLEEKVLISDSKKYKKYSTMEDFSSVVAKQSPKTNVFGIADSFSRRNKIETWILYTETVLAGVAPEEISGIIFWKIKTMILNGSKVFSLDELKRQSSELVSLYHRAHQGKIDFTVGLEQFILNSLTVKNK